MQRILVPWVLLLLPHFLFWMNLLPLHQVAGSTAPGPTTGHQHQQQHQRVLILDVDNTLYSEQAVRHASKTSKGIEEQIIENTYAFCKRELNMGQEEADDLFQKYGSTIEGLRQELLEKEGKEYVKLLMERYYDQVFSDDFDYTGLHLMSSSSTQQRPEQGDETGYTHNAAAASASLRTLLAHCPYPIYLASNSPSWHVRKVLSALGLDHTFQGMSPSDSAFTAGIGGTHSCRLLTPDMIVDEDVDYPTKSHPKVFFKEVMKAQPSDQQQSHQPRFLLLDDSKHNLAQVTRVGSAWEGMLVQDNLHDMLGIALGHVDPDFVFDDVAYLEDKNKVDANAIHRGTWETLANEIVLEDDGTLRVTDLGAGLLMLLKLILEGSNDNDLPSLVSLLDGKVTGIEYDAYESNLGLFRGIVAQLTNLGFLETPRNEPRKGDTYIFVNQKQNIMVRVHWYDYETEVEREREDPPHVICGCCFADLMEPDHLVASLQCYLNKLKNGGAGPTDTLVYLPITFAGTTQFLPAAPFAKSSSPRRGGWIPSDTVAFRLYSKALAQDQGHNTDPFQLVDSVERHGGELVTFGSSNWKIDKKQHPIFWKTMLYFFGKVAAPKLLEHDFDSLGWIERAKTYPKSILVSNVDLLFRLKAKTTTQSSTSTDSDADDKIFDAEEIQFTAPYLVGTSKKVIDLREDLGPDQVLIKSECSLISSGTELKIYQGMFDDATLDVNIDGMTDERMEYPLAYGYSLVGRITHVGSNMDPDLVGKLAFTFSPHSTHVVASKAAIQLVPDGIDAKDAIFMPSVETALSLTHDAHVRIGEQVAVYGQGLIGLLVTSLLALQKTKLDLTTGGGSFGAITTFDTIPDRLAMSATMGASQALLPSAKVEAGPFDVCIEVSGNARALQSAIDNTRNGGRVIVGSWYGNSEVSLKLGIDFHRSHKTIKTSQVSDIPAELRELWSKDRRFALTWELVKLLQPSRLLTKTTTLASAADAYESLEKGDEVAVAFRYNT